MTRQRQECFSAICLLRIVKKAAFIGLLFWREYFCKRLTMKTANKTILGGHWKRHLALFLHRTLKAALCDELYAQYWHVASRGQFLLLLDSTLSRWAFPLSCHSVQSRGLAPCGPLLFLVPSLANTSKVAQPVPTITATFCRDVVFPQSALILLYYPPSASTFVAYFEMVEL